MFWRIFDIWNHCALGQQVAAEKKSFLWSCAGVYSCATPNWNVSACSFRSGLNLATTFVFYCDNFKESYWKKSWSDLSFVKSQQCTETFVVLVSSERISNRVFWLGFFSAAAASFIHVAHSAILLLVLPTLVWREKPYKSLKTNQEINVVLVVLDKSRLAAFCRKVAQQ